jgi:hypothetical protein
LITTCYLPTNTRTIPALVIAHPTCSFKTGLVGVELHLEVPGILGKTFNSAKNE